MTKSYPRSRDRKPCMYLSTDYLKDMGSHGKKSVCFTFVFSSYISEMTVGTPVAILDHKERMEAPCKEGVIERESGFFLSLWGTHLSLRSASASLSVRGKRNSCGVMHCSWELLYAIKLQLEISSGFKEDGSPLIKKQEGETWFKKVLLTKGQRLSSNSQGPPVEHQTPLCSNVNIQSSKNRRVLSGLPEGNTQQAASNRTKVILADNFWEETLVSKHIARGLGDGSSGKSICTSLKDVSSSLRFHSGENEAAESHPYCGICVPCPT